jgi:hypothetical protein
MGVAVVPIQFRLTAGYVLQCPSAPTSPISLATACCTDPPVGVNKADANTAAELANNPRLLTLLPPLIVISRPTSTEAASGGVPEPRTDSHTSV